jgi:hypothetical protein
MTLAILHFAIEELADFYWLLNLGCLLLVSIIKEDLNWMCKARKCLNMNSTGCNPVVTWNVVNSTTLVVEFL